MDLPQGSSAGSSSMESLRTFHSMSSRALIETTRRGSFATLSVLARPGDVGAKRTTIDADLGAEQGGASRLPRFRCGRPRPGSGSPTSDGDRTLAEDLVQEAFLRFVGRLHHLRDPEAFDAYLRRTLGDLSKDLFRRRALERSPPRTADTPSSAKATPTSRCRLELGPFASS